MNNKKKSIQFGIFSIVILTLSLFLSGCNEEEYAFILPVISEETYGYISDTYLIREPQETNFTFPGMSFSYEENSIKYYFPDAISSDLRDKFINHQKFIVSFLVLNGFIEENIQVTLYVLEEYPARTESENHKAFFDIEDTQTYQQILTTLQLYYGDFSNYGILFGLSNIIAEQLGFVMSNSIVSNHDLISFTETDTNNAYLDLTYPCFLEKYSDSALPYIQSIAINFSKYLLEDMEIGDISIMLQNQNSSQEISHIEYYEKINTWLTHIGSTTQLIARTVPISFTNGGIKSPLIIWTEHGKYYVYHDFSEYYLDELGVDYFASNYPKMIEAIQNVELDMRASDALFKDPETDLSPLDIVLESVEEVLQSSTAIAWYSNSKHTAYNATIATVSHEYLHHLTTPAIGYNWQYEAIAIYYNLLSSFEIVISQSHVDTMIEYDLQEARALLDFLGRDYQEGDFPTLCDIVLVMHDVHEVHSLDAYAMISISNYVKNTYGDEMLRQIFLHQDTIESEISLTWEELVNEWDEWLTDTYGSIGQIIEFDYLDNILSIGEATRFELPSGNQSWFWNGTPVFSPDALQVYWSRFTTNQDESEIWYMDQVDGVWSSARKLVVDGIEGASGSPIFLDDPNQMYFMNLLPDGTHIIYHITRIDGVWSNPVALDITIPEGYEYNWNFSIADNHNVYFSLCSLVDGYSGIYYAVYQNGSYGLPIAMNALNGNNFNTSAPYVAPDESFILFDSDRPGGFGHHDLYMTVKDINGNYSAPINLGNKVNDDEEDFGVSLSEDGMYLFFTARRGSDPYFSPYWIYIREIEVFINR